MKQNTLRGFIPLMAVLMLLTIWPLHTAAKKIKYSEQIVYSGKVDSNGQPNGQGTLTTTYGEYKDILEGIFENGVVREATLRLQVFEKKYEFLKFQGIVGFAVTDDNKSVNYTLKDGTAECEIEKQGKYRLYPAYYELQLNSDEPLHIVSTPNATTCNVQIDSISRWFDHKIFTNGNNNGAVRPPFSDKSDQYLWITNSYLFRLVEKMGLKENNIKSIKSKTTLCFDNTFTLIPDDDPLLKIECDNGTIMQEHHDTISLSFSNGDFVKYYSKDCTIYSLKKTYTDGVLECEKPGTATFKDNETSKTGIAVLSLLGHGYDKYKYIYIRACDVFKTIVDYHQEMVDISGPAFLKQENACVFYGKAGEAIDKVIKEDPKGYFDLGMALNDEGKVEDAEHWIDKAYAEGLPEAKKYVAEQEAKAEEELRRKLESYHAHMDGSGEFFVNRMEETERGQRGSNLINLGLCYQFGYGIDKDMSKAFSYYKDALESYNDEVRACAHLLVGMCYWKGEGTAKNQAQAFKEFSAYSEFSKSHWSGFEDIIPRWTSQNLNNLVKPKEMLAYKHYYHAQCYEQGIGTQKYLEEAIQFYGAAIQYADIADAYYKLGYYTEKGKFAQLAFGIPNREFAKELYRKAAQLGDNRAKQALNRM